MPRRLWLSLLLAGAAASTLPAQSQRMSLSAADARRVADLVRQMTLDEKIGQMTQPDQQFLKDPADVESLFFGSLLSGGDSDPPTNSRPDWRAMYERLQGRALRTRLKIPLLYGVDAVHGHSNVLGAVIFPHNVGLGATRNAKLVEEIGRITAQEVRATGINWTFGPCIAVPRDERWGRTYEGFSEDPVLVAELGAAAVRGLQAGGLQDPRGVLACAKHFAGDGGTAWGTGMADAGSGRRYPLDRGDTRGDAATLRRLFIDPYVPSIKSGVGSIMVTYNSWNGLKASGHRGLLTDILKTELGFEGFLISDYDAIDELPGDYRSDIRESVNAGMDMFMVPQKYREFITTLKALVEAGEVSMARIDDAVTRILRVKAAMGLLAPGWTVKVDPELEKAFGSEAHRRVARQAVRESLVLLKNDGRTLPITGAKRIHVAGRNADDLGAQSGGWTITWQGKRGPVTTGTTILEGIRRAAGPKTQVTFAADGSGAAGADLAIVVVGEDPYAEFLGDREDLALADLDQKAIAAVRRAGVPVVMVVVSGRPLILGPALESSRAVVAAWLPGTEGDGVADVLFGRHAPAGKLPFTWPRTMDQIPINVGDTDYAPLFPFGFGLSYR
ncbi:MAG TPA: glycoside hydrolase family 3 N-terminal domain-containing protein [Vicinamibacterales bacterium]|nr:glycoside hydrolase family 3 N-terminal domain-containing protein [Vicinamibacterales bacterium]